LDVRGNLIVSQVNKRFKQICRDQHIWHNFCLELCEQHPLLLQDTQTIDYKILFVSLCEKTPAEIESFLMLNWILRRSKLTTRDPQFLQLSIHLYAARNTPNELKQILYLDTTRSAVHDGVYFMKFKPYANQDFPPVFFYGERNIFSVIDLVAVGRILEPRERKIMDNISLNARAPRNSGWHFNSSWSSNSFPLARVRIFPLSSKQLERIGVPSRCPRETGTGHSNRWESAEDTNSRLQSSSSTINYNVGEIVDLEVCIHVEQMFRFLNANYFTKAEGGVSDAM